MIAKKIVNLLLLSLIVFTLTEVKAQNDYRKGFVITNTLDTVHGFINYRLDAKNAKVCTFKKDETSVPIHYTPGQLIGFRFLGDKFFVSRDVVTQNGKDQLFLEYLFNGIVSVYYYDDGTDHYLIEERDHQLQELKKETRKIYKGETLYTYEYKAYIGLLKNAFKESPTISKEAEHLSLSHKSLIALAKKYHAEVTREEKGITYQKELQKGPFTFNVLVGLNGISLIYDTYSLSGGDEFYVKEIDFGTKYLPVFGISINKALPALREGLSIQYEATYSKKVSYQGSAFKSEGLYSFQNDIKINWASFNNSVLIRYSLFKGILIPHAGIGYSIVSQNGLVSDWKAINNFTSEIDSEKTRQNSFFSNLYSPVFGIGFKKVISVDLRYQWLLQGGKAESAKLFSFVVNVPLWKTK